MASTNHLEQLLQGVDAWNAWRQKEPSLDPDLSGANLAGANLGRANLSRANLYRAILSVTNLGKANLSGANLHEANLAGADLSSAILIETNLTNADLTGCRVYGICAWDLNLGGAKQRNVVITRHDQPQITVDDI